MSNSHSTKKLEGDRPAGTTPGPKVGSPGAARAFQPHSQTLQKPARPKTRNSKRRSAYKSGPSLLWLLPFGLVALAVVAIFLVLLGGNQISGRLAAEKTSYDFGQVKLNGGLVTTQIPLKVQEDGVLVSKIATTWMCTKARLVQAGKTSEWFGMPMGDTASPPVDFKLTPNQPAFLEVSIDPAAHGDAGIGPIQRGVSLLTATGQGLQFQLSGVIVRG